jgi:glucokinase
MHRVGVDLGGTKIQTVVVDQSYSVTGSNRQPTPRKGGPKAVTRAIANSVNAAIKDSGVKRSEVMGVGVGSPGQIDKRAGTVSHAGNLPDWSGTYALGPELSTRVKMSVDLGNDVQVAVRSEAELGSGATSNSLLGVFVGTGIGGGIIINRKMWLGRGAAGEIGHTVVDVDGPPCPCGRNGCLEAYAGRSAMEIQARKWEAEGRSTNLFHIMKRRNRDRLTSGIWARALKSDDEMATELIDRAIWALGVAIGSATNLLDTDMVVVGGGIGVRLGQPFVDKIAEASLPRMVMATRPPVFRTAALGDLGGAIGAALLPLD